MLHKNYTRYRAIIFGAMAKDLCGQISEYFGILSVEQLITNRHNRFINRYWCQENYFMIVFNSFLVLCLLVFISNVFLYMGS